MAIDVSPRTVQGALLYSAEIPLCGEPFQIRLIPRPRLLLAGEERVGLVQDERVGPALPPGLVGDGQFGGVDPGVDVLPALLGERPLEGALAPVFQEHAPRLPHPPLPTPPAP